MDQLQFIADGENYQAGYSISVIIYDQDGQQTAGDSWERTVKIPNYHQLQRGDSYFGRHPWSCRSPPGGYRAKITCRDENSDRVGQFDQQLTVPSLSSGNYIGGVKFERDYHGSLIPSAQSVFTAMAPGR